MKRIKQLSTIGLCLIAVGGIAALAQAGSGASRGDGTPNTFELSGSVGPIYPSVDASLPLKVENPNRVDISVTEVVVEVFDASLDCGAENLIVDPIEVPFTVPARGERTVVTQVRFVDDVDNDCQGATFALEYRGIAVRP